MPQQDFKAWNSVIRGLCIDTRHKEALMLLFRCLRSSIVYKPDHLVFAAILKSCTALLAGNLGRALHSFVVKLGHGSCQVTSKALLNMYAKYGAFDDCQKLFDQLSPMILNIIHKDVVSWNAMIAGLAENEFLEDAFTLFSLMVKGPLEPNYSTIASILPLAKWPEAEYLFWKMDARDLVSWNTIIAGYASNGYVDLGSHHDANMIFKACLRKTLPPGILWSEYMLRMIFPEQALCLFSELQDQGMRTDAVTL
ncbi:putative pentatricopeptide repeat-containing protein At5g08490 [Prosopis cineraria]|uniref:putative pentatricopeptide repeat-containing protein At5g08490 n=1 Tax=Prosopis cineraria TaxID=364024 RepID=UPI00240F94F4|nr:putative pentatricopeptide repeat-containing protein At5g08490 [Prosopis cineraria]